MYKPPDERRRTTAPQSRRSGTLVTKPSSRSKLPFRSDSRPDVSEVMAYFANFQRRVIQDAVNESTATYWRHRADDFRAALPRQDEWHGGEGLVGVRRRRERLLGIIAACEAAAQVAMFEDHHELREVFETVGVDTLIHGVGDHGD